MIEGVNIVVEGKTTPGPSVTQTMDELAFAMATAIAQVVPARVRDRGDLAGQVVPSSARRSGKPYFRTGGLLRSARPIKLGLSSADVRFVGASLGASGRPVSNAEKARTVLEAHGVNVLALSQAELRGLAAGIVGALARATSAAFPVQWSTPLPQGDLAAVLALEMRRTP